MSDHYKYISKFYNLLSCWYSFGKIPRCRNAFIPEIAQSVRNNDAEKVQVCYVGAGHGDDAILAAECGAFVTVADISESMIAVFQKQLRASSSEVNARVNIICDDFRNISNHYDWVIANFFLNVFSESEVPTMLDELLKFCHRSSCLVIGDFVYEKERNFLTRTLQKINWNLALIIFRFIVKNAKHPIYDYRHHLGDRGWEMVNTKKFSILGVNFYQSSKYKYSKLMEPD